MGVEIGCGHGGVQKLGHSRAGAKGNQPARWPAPTQVSGVGDRGWPSEGYGAIPGKAPTGSWRGTVLADTEWRDRVTAPGELAVSFQGLVQASWGSGWSSLALWERGCSVTSAPLPGSLQAFQALRLGIRSHRSCPTLPPVLLTNHPPDASLQLPGPPAGPPAHPSPQLLLLPTMPLPMSLAHRVQLLPSCHLIQENFPVCHANITHTLPHPRHSPAPLFSPQHVSPSAL